MSTLVSIIVLNWNGRTHLEACLSALAAQPRRGISVIVVDNGSTDDSVDWVRRQSILPVLCVALSDNLGFAAGNAAGLRVVPPETEFVVLLNNDTAPEPGWLESLVQAAMADPKRGAVASLMVDWSGKTIDSAGDGIRVTGRGYQRFHGRPRGEAPVSGPVFSACAGAALYRKRMLEEVGFLDERFFIYGEDTDLCFRGRLAGWTVWFCAEAGVRHRVSSTFGVGSERTVYLNERNHLWSIAKCMPASLLWKYSWVHLLEQPARGIFFARRRRFKAWLRGISDGLRGMRTMMADRRRIQSSRRVESRAIDRCFIYPTHLGGRDHPVIHRP